MHLKKPSANTLLFYFCGCSSLKKSQDNKDTMENAENRENMDDKTKYVLFAFLEKNMFRKCAGVVVPWMVYNPYKYLHHIDTLTQEKIDKCKKAIQTTKKWFPIVSTYNDDLKRELTESMTLYDNNVAESETLMRAGKKAKKIMENESE